MHHLQENKTVNPHKGILTAEFSKHRSTHQWNRL